LEQGRKSAAGLGYFAGVDGLRAVAVLSVLIYHLNHGLIPGGYTGVDVFFVISGFVVTGSLAHLRFTRFPELLTYFYARRLTRVMPALIVSLTISIVVYVLLIPKSWLSHANENTALAAFFGLSNVVLALNDDSYFSPSSDFNPWLHTWSLGVEEQFYFMFPFLLYIGLRATATAQHRTLMLRLVAVLGAISLIVCAVLAAVKWRYTFYLLPARFWELAVGMLLAITFETWRVRLTAAGQRAAMLIAGGGVILLLLAFAIPSSNAFPFPLAIIPVVGTTLLIMVVCARPGDGLSRMIASKFMLFFGLRSYSIYLWHWPIYVLLRWTIGMEAVAVQCAAVAAAIIAGSLSYRLVENPLRHAPLMRQAPRGAVVAVALSAIFCGAVVGGLAFRDADALSISKTAQGHDWYADSATSLIRDNAECQLKEAGRGLAGGSVTTWTRTQCQATTASGRLFVIGNSHAKGYEPMLRQYALDSGHEVRLYFKSGCAFLLLTSPHADEAGCATYIAESVSELRRELGTGDVLFMASMRLDQNTNQWGQKLALDPHTSRKVNAAMAEARTVLTELGEHGARLVFEAPKPLFAAPAYRCADWYTKINPACEAGLTVDRQQMLALRTPVMDRMRTLAASVQGVGIWDPLPALCPDSVCSAFDGSRPLFFDMHHLSGYGNQVLRSSFASYMNAAIGKTIVTPRGASQASQPGHLLSAPNSATPGTPNSDSRDSQRRLERRGPSPGRPSY
jgi:peptidoglycan/LPS O-acetylase OafA/YrhL